ncbi:hypothetical protein GW881_03915 [Candidatus Roizmanbacteria bacterium]|nr:hypothetical protein [Candidatus Roizmanbacteria bacterium]
MAELNIDQDDVGSQAVVQGQRLAETLTPLKKAQQRTRIILNHYIGQAPKPNDKKQLGPEEYGDLIDNINVAVFYGNFDKTKELLHDLQQTGKPADEDMLAFLLQATAIQANRETGKPEQRPTHNTLSELVGVQLALTIACYKK